MKSSIYTLTLLVLCAGQASAQSTQYLEAGNIRSLVSTQNVMWWDTASGEARCEYPKGSGKHVGFAAAVWVGGYDGQSQLRVAGQRYGQAGSDFFAGPIDALGASTVASQAAWNRVWSVSRAQLDTFFSFTTHTVANTPKAILEWPGKGNPNAKGANGVALSVTADAAPFIEAGTPDGIYNPLQGDYPKLMGDQTLWHVFNDVGGAKTATGTSAMPVQIGVLAWAFKRNTVADNIQFYEYSITNRGAALDSTVVALFADLDLGFGFDDYIGFDSARRMGYQYNAAAIDGTAGMTNAYGNNIPVAGVTILNAVGDDVAAGIRVPTGAFTYFTNGGIAEIQDPATGLQFYRYMTGTNKAGNPFTNDFTGVANMPTRGFGSGPTSRYLFYGDPAVSGTWSECYSGNAAGDRRFLLSSAAFSLPAGDTRKLAMALVVSPSAGGCPSVSLTGIRQTTDTAYVLYDNPPAYVPTPLAIRDATGSYALTLYPNPAQGFLIIRHAAQPTDVVDVLDAAGRRMNAGTVRTADGYRVSTASLPAGVYAVRLRSARGVWTGTFVKE